ncbi:MAG: AMP-binding protein [SAR324 cluster bacterium]|nr:AMP-binding protein [SAR324 cluster bacterium]MBL7034588.1 AMP-binding protein [SAR324 cluster bacterium]
MALREHSIYDCILNNARNYPNKTALVSGDLRLTFAEVPVHVNCLARGLVNTGFEKGDRIAVLLNNCAEYALLLAACARIGVVAVCLNTRTSSDEMRKVIENTKPKALVFQTSCEQQAEDLRDLLPARQFYSTDAASILSTSFDQLLDENPSALTEPQPDADEGWLIIPTAAVDGIPKGALLSQRNVMASAEVHFHHFDRAAVEAHLLALPIFHVMGLTSAWATFISGGKNVVLKQFDDKEAVRLIDAEQLTYFGSFPPILERVLDAAKETGSKLESLCIVYGLEGPDNILRLQKETRAVFWTGFGQAETTAFVTAAPASACPGASGQATLLNSVSVVNELEQEVPMGDEGEIVVRGENIFLEYWDMPEATAYAQRNGWHHTGDIGRFDEEGYLWYVKRKAEKELIKTGGENVYPGEVESVLLKHTDINNCCVIGVPDKTWGEAVKAVCVLKPGSKLSVEEVRDHVGGQIAGFKKPRQVIFVEELPQENNEVDREAVKSKWGE